MPGGRDDANDMKLPETRSTLSALLLGSFLLSMVAWYPGFLEYDSRLQYEQAVSGNYNDWHPPVMARLWSLLLKLEDGPGPLFALHMALYWLGFALLAHTLHRTGRVRTAWAIYVVGLFPPFLFTCVTVLKDIGMAAVLLTAFGLAFRYRARSRKMPVPVMMASLALIVYATLVRPNGVIASMPVAVYLISPSLYRRPATLLAVYFLGIVSAVIVAPAINQKLLGAQAAHAEVSLFLFDLAGTAHFSGDDSIPWPGNHMPAVKAADCYEPIAWDIKCHFAWDFEPADARAAWASAIWRHPLAYLTHRLAHFNSEIGLIVPYRHAHWRILQSMTEGLPLPPQPAPGLLDALWYSPATAPAFALVTGCLALALLWPVMRKEAPPLAVAAFYLNLSGLLYILGYLLLGVGTGFRYQYWGMIASYTAAALTISARQDVFARPGRLRTLCIAIAVTAFAALCAVHAVEGDAFRPWARIATNPAAVPRCSAARRAGCAPPDRRSRRVAAWF